MRNRENSAKCTALKDISKTDTFGKYHRRLSRKAAKRRETRKGNVSRVLDIRGSKSPKNLRRKTTQVKKIRKGFKQVRMKLAVGGAGGGGGEAI